MSFCKDCRTKLVNTPLPGWVRTSLIVVVAMLIYAFAQFPSSVSAGIAFERGKKAEAAANYAEAVTQYKIVVERFPESTLAIARLGISQWHAHDLPGAVDTLQKLEGRKAPDDEVYDEVNQVMHQIEAEIKLRMKR